MNKKFFIGLGLTLIMGICFLLFQFSPPQFRAAKERIVINLGTSEPEIIDKLHSQGYIRNPTAFNIVLTIQGWHNKMRPGGYNISKSMPVWEITDILVNHPSEKWVVIPEGLRATEIAEKLQETLKWTNTEKAEFLLNSKEGYLFPDTYLLNLDYTGRGVAKRMENQFNEKVADFFKEARENNIRNDTLIIIASLIQREAANEKEMSLISGIIWNRLLKGMPLEIDATIQYALGKPGNWWPVIKSEDYRTDSVYNTYLHKGRPPSPISSPGLSAIKAVIYPEETDCFFYLHDREGKIHCAVSYQEHLENIEKYF